MGAYSGLAGTITGGGGGAPPRRTEFPADYVPNCVDQNLLLNRNDHLEVLVHLRNRYGVTRQTRWYTPGPSGRWGFGRYAHDFRGMNRTAPIFLRDFKDWIARTVRATFGSDAVLIAPGVCVKTVWKGDGRRIDAPPYAPPAAAASGPLPADIPLDMPVDDSPPASTGSGWDIIGGRPSTAGRSPFSPDILSRLRGRGGSASADLPPSTEPDASGDVTVPPATEGEGGELPPEPTLFNRIQAYVSENPVVGFGALAVAVYAGYQILKSREPAKANRRRRR